MLYSFFLSCEGKSPGRQLWIWNMFTKNKSAAPKMTTGLQNLKKSLDNL